MIPIQKVRQMLHNIPQEKTLEIGAGRDIDTGYGVFHLDVRELPHIEFVQDASNLSNMPDESFDKIVAKHVLEHISWRKTFKTLREWNRVLKIGGEIVIEIPSARHFKTMLDGDKSAWIRGESEFEYFNRVVFGHQDYSENSHLSGFTEEWLFELMQDAKFKKIRTEPALGTKFQTPFGESSIARFKMIATK